MTRLRARARDVVRDCTGAGPEHAVIFGGSGATAGLNRLVHLLGLRDPAARPVVLIGPYEHHSNILPWRESGAEVIEIPESATGGPDIGALRAALAASAGRRIVGAFSAASNVTGITSDVAGITRILKDAGARAVWDYAGGGPYLPIAMTPAKGAEIDAIVLSPHKFPGGPGASGILVLRRDAVVADLPSAPGGGTVRWVTPERHLYANALEAREEGGTPNVIGDLRAALALLVKDAVGADWIAKRNAELARRALAAWRDTPQIEILGNTEVPRLPIFSFRIRDRDGQLVHHQYLTRLLSDRFGIQARGGCACAGPYVHRLLGIDAAASDALLAEISAGREDRKPGFVRLNFSHLGTDAEAGRIISAVEWLAEHARGYEDRYRCDTSRAIFTPA